MSDNRKPWTHEEEQYLCEHWVDKHKRRIANELSRSVKSVTSKAERMGLTSETVLPPRKTIELDIAPEDIADFIKSMKIVSLKLVVEPTQPTLVF